MDQKKINKQIFEWLERLERKVLSNTIKRPISINKSEDEIERLAKKTKVSKGKIQEMFDFEDETLTLVKVIGENFKEKTQNVALLVLLGYKYYFNKNEVFSQEIRRNVGENGIPLENFATYLNELIPSSIRRKGKQKSAKTKYRLLAFGESKAKKLIKEINESENT